MRLVINKENLTKVAEIERAIKKLDNNDLKRFRSWYADFDQPEWDRQISEDIKAGKLDDLATRALNDYKNHKYKNL